MIKLSETILSHFISISSTSYLARVFSFFIRSLSVLLLIHVSILIFATIIFLNMLFLNCPALRPIENDKSYS